MGQLKIPRITTAQRTGGAGLTLAAGELVYDTDTGYLYKGDGSTAGGVQVDAAGGTVDTSGSPVQNDFARFTDHNTIEGRSYAEVKQDLSLEIGTDVAPVASPTFTGTVAVPNITDLESAITANTAKTGITSGQTSAITANSGKTSFPGFGTSGSTALVGNTSLLALGTSSSTALAGNTALLALGTSSSTALAGNTTTISGAQASAITANTAKTGISSGQTSAITANTAKTGITSGQASAIVANTAKTSYTDASAVTANTAKVGITTQQASDITANNAKTGITSGQTSAITANTAKVTNATHTGDVTGATALTIGTGKVITAMILDDNVTADKLANSINSAIAANTSKTGITSGQASAITANTAKTGITSGQSSAITANTAKTSFSDLTGEVTSSGAATTISDNIVDEANLLVSNNPTNGYFLSAQSGATGGLTWAAAGGGGTDVTLAGSRDYITISGQEITRNAIDLAADVTGVLPSANLDTDTAHLSGAQNFTGAKVFSAGITPSFIKHTISGNGAADYGPGADILYGISNETTTAGAIYVLRAGAWVLINATLASTSRQLCAVAVGTNSSTNGMLIRGCVTLASAIVGTDVEGHQIYASTTAGYAAIAPPTASGNGVRVLGYSLNVGSKKIFFDPDKTWLEI